MTTDSFAKWSAVLAQARLGVAPAELHGSITAVLCTGWGGRPHELLALLALQSDAVDDASSDALQALLDRAVADIADHLRARAPIELLLPDAQLAVRANAVVDWCRSFLGGLGLTGVLAGSGQTPEVRDLLADFGRIAAMHLVCDDDDGRALEDLLDFVRNGVVQLHAAFARTGRS